MKIVMGKENAQQFDSKYTLLELDTMRIPNLDEPITAYCVVDSIPITQISNSEQYKNLHNKLMENYRLKNWKFCEDAIEHLLGKWNGELDTFYEDISQRVQHQKSQPLDIEWTGIIDKT